MRRGDRNDPDTDPFSPFYGRRGMDGRRGLADLRMQQGFPQNPRMTPGLGLGRPYGGLNPRRNLMNCYQGPTPPPTDGAKKWVLETCGNSLEEATGSMKIRGIPDDFPQFVVNRPTMQLQTAFKNSKSKHRSVSRLMFHGTPLPNLQPILQGGFKGGQDGAVWVAREPSTSLMYALKGKWIPAGGSRELPLGGDWL
jgi:hypothetical protein